MEVFKTDFFIYAPFYHIKENIIKIEIANPDFVEKNKYKYRIIYKNKIYPLNSELEFKKDEIEDLKIKIKLICYNNLSYIHDKTKNEKSLYKFKKTNKFKKYINRYIYSQHLKISANEISEMVYKIKPGRNKIQIFGKKFVENNRDKCFILYKDKIRYLETYFQVKDINKEDEQLKLLLTGLNDVSNRSYMFQECDSLVEFTLHKMDYDNSKKYTFFEEKDLGLEDSEKYNEFYPKEKEFYLDSDYSSVNFSCKRKSFENYSTLSFWVDEMKKKMNDICQNMNCMFNECSSLISLPDISKWNTINVNNMGGLFSECSSLITLPIYLNGILLMLII